MADGDSVALAGVENNLQAQRPVEPPSLLTWKVGTSEACGDLQTALLDNAVGCIPISTDVLLLKLFNTVRCHILHNKY